jgi:putative transposase
LSLYYEPVPESETNLCLMRIIDELYLQHPFYGSRRMTAVLREQGRDVNRKRVQRLMRLMGLEAIYPKPHLSAGGNHRIYPYLLRNVEILRVNQVWSTDITYVPMARGFLYLVAVMDWHSRAVLSWRLSNSLDGEFCLEALDEALCGKRKPEIFNTDQGVQFTSQAFTERLERAAVAISMDGRGRALDNVFVERLWWSVKYENVYLKAYASGTELHQGLTQYFQFYNRERPHQALDDRTPWSVYSGRASRNASANLARNR